MSTQNWAKETGKFIKFIQVSISVCFFFPQPLDVSACACWVDILFSSGCYLIRSGNRDRRDLNETEQANGKDSIEKEQPFPLALPIFAVGFGTMLPRWDWAPPLVDAAAHSAFLFGQKKAVRTGATRPKRVDLVIENASTRCLAACICRLDGRLKEP